MDTCGGGGGVVYDWEMVTRGGVGREERLDVSVLYIGEFLLCDL